LDNNQWNLLRDMVEHDMPATMKYINTTKNKVSFMSRVKGKIYRETLRFRPTYRKQLEISRLIDDLATENEKLRQRVQDLEKTVRGKNGD
jgi:hypothetical protein